MGEIQIFAKEVRYDDPNGIKRWDLSLGFMKDGHPLMGMTDTSERGKMNLLNNGAYVAQSILEALGYKVILNVETVELDTNVEIAKAIEQSKQRVLNHD